MSTFIIITTLINIIIFAILIFAIARFSFFGFKTIAAGKKAILVSQFKEGATKRILVIGDSTSYGTGSSKPENSLVGRLINDFPEVEIINLSENAMNIKRLYEKISELKNESFDIIVFHIGGMDALTFTRSKTISNYVEKIREETRKMGHPIVILVSMTNIGALPASHFPINTVLNRRSKYVSNIFNNTCIDCDIVHVPLYAELNADPLLSGNRKLFADDNWHPNDEGYGIWYEQIKKPILAHLSI